jgi:hypothetical protein
MRLESMQRLLWPTDAMPPVLLTKALPFEQDAKGEQSDHGLLVYRHATPPMLLERMSLAQQAGPSLLLLLPDKFSDTRLWLTDASCYTVKELETRVSRGLALQECRQLLESEYPKSDAKKLALPGSSHLHLQSR